MQKRAASTLRIMPGKLALPRLMATFAAQSAGKLGWRKAEAREDSFESVAFTLSVIALSARLAGCDGPVTAAEYATFRGAFPMPKEEEGKIVRLFRSALAEEDVAVAQARRIAQFFPGRRELYEDVLGRLLQIALVDGPINHPEMAVLRQTAQGLGLGQETFDRILKSHVVPAQGDPYAVLGVAPSASPEALKRRYRQLMREYHPDGLEAYGVPREVIALAADKVAAVNAAYDAIKRRRGIR